MVTGNIRSRRITTNLTIVVIFTLLLIAGIAVANQVIVQNALNRQEADATTINIAGRQRMLSQRISKIGLNIQRADPDSLEQSIAEMVASVRLFESSHQGLQSGDASLGLPGDNSANVRSLFESIQPSYESILRSSKCLVEQFEPDVFDVSCATTTNNVGVILDNEDAFLQGMDAIAAQYNQEADQRVQNLKNIQNISLGTTLVSLILLGLFVFLPMLRINSNSMENLQQVSLEAIHRAEELTRLQNQYESTSRGFEAVLDVNKQISTILDTNRLLQDVVDLTKERFRLYHAHIYLVDELGENVLLTAGAGHVGRQMVSERRSISLQNLRSIVATAGRTQQSVIINDVGLAETFLPHPLLPDTRAELAVPLVARGELIGVLDVQSDQANYFDVQTLSILETLGNQVAVALSNATLYQVAERTSRHEQALGSIAQRLQGAANVEEVLQVAVRELGKALRVPHTAIQLDMANTSESGD